MEVKEATTSVVATIESSVDKSTPVFVFDKKLDLHEIQKIFVDELRPDGRAMNRYHTNNPFLSVPLRFFVRLFVAPLLGAFLLAPALALGFEVNTTAPADYAAVEQELHLIEQHLENNSQCGGWNFDATDSDVRPTIQGLPGHRGDPLGHVISGMAERLSEENADPDVALATDMYFPDGVEGYMSACRPDNTPFFDDHPCQRPGPEVTGEGVPVYGDGDLVNIDPVGNNVEWTCDALCDDLNRRWVYIKGDALCCQDHPVDADDAACRNWILRFLQDRGQQQWAEEILDNAALIDWITRYRNNPQCQPYENRDHDDPACRQLAEDLKADLNGNLNLVGVYLNDPNAEIWINNFLDADHLQQFARTYLDKLCQPDDPTFLINNLYQEWFHRFMQNPPYQQFAEQVLTDVAFRQWMTQYVTNDRYAWVAERYIEEVVCVHGGSLNDPDCEHLTALSAGDAALRGWIQNFLAIPAYNIAIQRFVNDEIFALWSQEFLTNPRRQQALTTYFQQYANAPLCGHWIGDIFDQSCQHPAADCNVQDIDETECFDTDTQPPPIPDLPDGCNLLEAEEYYCCTRHPVDVGLQPNCKPCSGADCRGEVEVDPVADGEDPDPYLSYYRRYNGQCSYKERNQPDIQLSFPVSCYGLYREYDTLDEITSPEDRFCVMAVTDPDFQQQRDDAKEAHGFDREYGQNDDFPDPPSDAFHELRDPDFQFDEDLWYPNLGGAFSLINGEVLEEHYGGNLEQAVLQLDDAEHRAYVQLTTDQPLSDAVTLRAFDHTVSNERRGRRTVVEWWQETEREINRAVSIIPTVRVLLPPGGAPGLADLEPDMEDHPELQSHDGKQWLEFAIRADESTIGRIATFMEEAFVLRLREERIPILVPLANPLKLRTIAHSWCAWFISEARTRVEDENQREQIVDCTAQPWFSNDLAALHMEVMGIIQSLEEYAERVEDVRKLRTELPKIMKAVLERQGQLATMFNDWLDDAKFNFDTLYLGSVDRLRGAQDRFQAIQQRYRDIHESDSLCRNNRYEVSIYSFLDDGPGGVPLLPGRPDLDGGIDDDLEGDDSDYTDPDSLPRFEAEFFDDVILDLSRFVPEVPKNLRPLMRDRIIAVPVPDPIQVEVDLDGYMPQSPVPTLPPLPPVPTIVERAIKLLEGGGPAPPPGGGDLPDIGMLFPMDLWVPEDELIDAIEDVIARMEYVYGRFLTAVTGDEIDILPGVEEDCVAFDQGICVHGEMDLRERAEHGICFRDGLRTKDDFESVGERYDPSVHDFWTCPRDDWACTPLLSEREYVYRNWSPDNLLFGAMGPPGPESDPFAELRREQFVRTVLSRDQELKLRSSDKDLIPSFGDPGKAIDLSPPPPAP